MDQTDNNKKKVFLLGGADLEMTTIKKLLEEYNHIVVDKGLNWSNAKLDAYAEELQKFSSEDYVIYGVELQENCPTPVNYIRIDHHNDFQDRQSSLGQVAEIIGHKLTEEEQLIAENDKGYYPAMEKYLSEKYPDMSSGDKCKKMDDVRIKDRKEQGVTLEEEKAASGIVDNGIYDRFGELVVVRIDDSISHMSALCDKLYPYRHLLIYRVGNEKTNELTFYGTQSEEVYKYVTDWCLNEELSYSGGGSNGYWGIKKGVLESSKIMEVVGYVKSYFTQSSHIFYFPFTWNKKECHCRKNNDGNPLKSVCLAEDSGWLGVEKCEGTDEVDIDTEKQELYNELNYFFPFVHKEIYECTETVEVLISETVADEDERKKWKESPRIRHFERREKGLKYQIVVRKNGWYNRYTLDIESINLNLYSTGVGMLSIYTKNFSGQYTRINQKDETKEVKPIGCDDILIINQYGRRVMSPFYMDIYNRTEIAETVSIIGLNLKDDFQKPLAWQYNSVIQGLLNDLDPQVNYEMVVDDRMFLMCWYKNTQCVAAARSLMEDCISERSYYKNLQTLSDYWYKYIFVDSSSPSCQDDHMKKQLLLDHTYMRWSNWNSLYGVTRYSFMFLTNETVPHFLLRSFETIYARMTELVLMQRATVLKFSEKINLLNMALKGPDNNKRKDMELRQKKVDSLCRDYIVFKNQFYFREITAQDQGIEMYDMLQNSLRLEDMVKDLDQDIQEIYQYHSIVEEQEGNKKAQTLNVIMSIFTPASCLAAFLTIGGWRDKWIWNCDSTWVSWLGVIIMLSASIITYLVFKFCRK